MARDPREFIKKVNSAFDMMDDERKAERKQLDEERKGFISGLSGNLAELIKPLFEQHIEQKGLMKEAIRDALSELQLPTPSVQVSPPQVRVNVPEVKVPEIKIPVTQFPTLMKVLLQDIDVKNPLPVVLIDPQGMKYKAMGGAGGFTQWASGGGPKAKTLIQGAEVGGNRRDVLVDEGGRVQVDIISGGGGTQFAEDVAHTSGDLGTLALIVRQDTATQLAGTDGDYTALVSDSAGRLHVNPSGLAYNSGVANATTLRVVHVTDIATSVNVTGFTASIETHPATPSGQSMADEEFNAEQVSIVRVTDFVQSTNVTQFANDALAKGTELNAGVLRVAQVTDLGTSTNVTTWAGDALAKGTELGAGVLRVYHIADQATSVRAIANSGVDIGDVDVLTLPNVTIGTVNPSIEVKQVSGFVDSVNVVGFTVTVNTVGSVAADIADDGDPPLKIGGISRTANPTAVAAGDRVSATFDDVGRLVTYPYQVRDLITTARVSLATGTETTLLAGVAGVFFDCIMITAANQSTAVVDLDIRDATGGGIVASLTIPADATVGWAPAVPYPQNEAANTWTIDMDDVTGTTVNVTALFVRNV